MVSAMEMTTLGAGFQVPTLGLGCAGMSGTYGAADEAESIATIRSAIDSGVTLLDTADFYGMGHNEMLIGRALRPGDRAKAVLSVKFGGLRGPDLAFRGIDARPVAVRNFLAYSLQRLGTDYIDIYRPARLDQAVPIEDGILATCRELGIGITAYGVLAQGLLTGTWQPTAGDADTRAHLPRFAAGNVEANLTLVEELRKVAAARGITVAQLAVAWVLAQGRGHGDIVARVGAKRPQRIAEALRAADLELSDQDLAAIEEAVPRAAVAGSRYAPALLALLDSER